MAAGPAGAAKAAAPGADWSTVRSWFRFSRQAPLNAANLCPPFSEVLTAQQALSRRLAEDVGFLNRRDVVQHEVADAREACADMLGLRDVDSLAFVRNTSEANAAIVAGLDLQPDDEVLLWDENHATNYRSWHYRQARTPFRVKRLSLPRPLRDEAQIVEAFVAALTPKTRVVSFSHLSNISGTRMPAKAICAAVHAHNPEILVHLDGAQSWGSMAVDLDDIGCDSYASSGHKWLCGPRGTGILMVRERWAERLQPLILGYDFAFDYPEEALQPDARRFENLGQRDTAAYGALSAAVGLHQTIGTARIEARIAELTQYTLQAFDRAGIETLTPKAPSLGHGVVVADLGGKHKAFGAFLALHNAGYASAFVHGNKVHCSVDGPCTEEHGPTWLRICPHIYNSTDDIDAAVAIATRIRDSNFEIVKEVVRFL